MIKYIQKSLDFASWNMFEKILVCFITTIIMSSTFYFSYITPYETFFDIILNWIISPVAAITGIVCVVLVAKENITNYYWGIINAIMYGAISWYSGYYGDWILNWFFFLPFQFIGWVVWKKYHMDTFSKVYIKPRKLTKQGIRIITIISIISLIGFGLFLSMVDHWFVQVMKRNESIYSSITAITGITLLGPILDSSTEVLQIIGQILMTLAYSQQWIFWILTNVITISMWILVIMNDKTTITWVLPIIFMWFGFLVNSFYGYYKWTEDAKEKREWSILKKRRNN